MALWTGNDSIKIDVIIVIYVIYKKKSIRETKTIFRQHPIIIYVIFQSCQRFFNSLFFVFDKF